MTNPTSLRAYLEQEESRLSSLAVELRAKLAPIESDLMDVKQAIAGLNGQIRRPHVKRKKMTVVEMAHVVLSASARGMRDRELCVAIDERFARTVKTRPETVNAVLRRAGPAVFARCDDGWRVAPPTQGRAP